MLYRNLIADVFSPSAVLCPVGLILGSGQKKGGKGITLKFYAVTLCVRRNSLQFIGLSVYCVDDRHFKAVFHRIVKSNFDHARGLDFLAFGILERDVDSCHDLAADCLLCLFYERLCLFIGQFPDLCYGSCGQDACCRVYFNNVLANGLLCCEFGHRDESNGYDFLSLCDLNVLRELSGLVFRLESRLFSRLACRHCECCDVSALIGCRLDGDSLSDLIFHDKVKLGLGLDCVSVLISNGNCAVLSLNNSIGSLTVRNSHSTACGSDLDCYAALLFLLGLFFNYNLKSSIFCQRVFPGGGVRFDFRTRVGCDPVLGDLKAFRCLCDDFDLLALCKLESKVCAIFVYDCFINIIVTSLLFCLSFRIFADRSRRVVLAGALVGRKDHLDDACAVEVDAEEILLFFLLLFGRLLAFGSLTCSYFFGLGGRVCASLVRVLIRGFCLSSRLLCVCCRGCFHDCLCG